VIEFATVRQDLGTNSSVFKVNPALLKLCVVRHKGKSSHDAPYGAVLVGPGGLLLEQCHLTSFSGAGMYIEGSGVCCQVERSRVEGCQQAGVLVNHCAQVYVNGSSIVNNGTHGVCIQRGAQALVLESHVNDNKGYGVAIVDTHNRGSSAVLKNNDFTNNSSGAMYIDESCIERVTQSLNSGMH
jgi:hypothetical protein